MEYLPPLEHPYEQELWEGEWQQKKISVPSGKVSYYYPLFNNGALIYYMWEVMSYIPLYIQNTPC